MKIWSDSNIFFIFYLLDAFVNMKMFFASFILIN